MGKSAEERVPGPHFAFKNKFMEKPSRKLWISIPPWILVGSAIILVPIFVFWTMQHINKQKEATTLLLLEKGAALIRSFEAGARTGMRGMMGGMMDGMMRGRMGNMMRDMMRSQGRGGFRLQNLLTETAQQPDIVHLIVTDINGTILAHNDPDMIGDRYGWDFDLDMISRSQDVQWRQVSGGNSAKVFEVFRRFTPTLIPFRGLHGRMMSRDWRQAKQMMHKEVEVEQPERIIFVGLDMGPIEEARKKDVRHTLIMAAILLLIWFAGIFSLFMVQAYRSTRTSLSRIRAFSDTVVENMPIGLMATDVDKKIVSVNQTAESVLELTPGEVIGTDAREVLPIELCGVAEELSTSEGIIEKEIDCHLKNGRTIPLDVSVSSLEGDDGAYLGCIVLFRDMTEIQSLKREIERSERLASLGRLAAGIAHEIRNPLSSIKGFATYFRERYKDVPDDQKTADIMVQEVERLNRVISQLLEFARPLTMEKKPTSLKTLIQHSLKVVASQAREKGITIETEFSEDAKDVSIDPDRINQVLLNLHLNAVEAMENGGLLTVKVDSHEESGHIRVTVADSGAGIDSKDLNRIFDPYFTTKQSGTGLGLAIVHKIIESHGGEVKVESEVGKGTTVSILLPAG